MLSERSRSKIKRISRLARPFALPFCLILTLILILQVIVLFMPVFTGKWINAIVRSQSQEVEKYLIYIALTYLAMRIVDCLVAHVEINKISTDLEIHTGEVTLSRVLDLSVGQISNQNSGFKQDTIKKGEAALSELLNTFFLEFIPSVMRVAISLIGLFYMNWRIGSDTTVSIALFVTASVLINKALLPRIKKNRKLESKLSTSYWELIKHLRLVMVSGQEARAIDEYSDEYAKYSKESKSIWTKYIWLLTFVREPFGITGFVLVYSMAGKLALKHDISAGDAVILIGWITNAYSALNSIGSMQRRLTRNFILIGNFLDLLEMPPAITVKENAVRPERIEGRIEFRNVSFKYPEYDAPVEESDEEESPETEAESEVSALHNVSFAIEPGEFCAFVGPSGSGKSTALNLILRGYDPDSGEVLIDSFDLRQVDHKWLRRFIGMVEQEPKLWDNTLRYNMLYCLNGKGNKVSNEVLDVVAREAKIDEFYPRLGPQKFETILGENGIQLSGGQRQRVAIARALMRNPRLLILDEATNALDATNERLVHEALRSAKAGRTMIIVAHRLSTVRHADKIIVFNKGRIEGIGTYSDLLITCPLFQELVKYDNEAV